MAKDESPFIIIHNFCSNNDHLENPLLEKILLHTYYKEYYEMKERHEAETAPLDEHTIKLSLLSDTNLEKNIEIALSQIDNEVKKKTMKIERRYKNKNGFVVIGLNLLSSFIFAFLLIGLFFLMENEIKPKMQTYLSSEAIASPPDTSQSK
jgi:hypothetical protein